MWVCESCCAYVALKKKSSMYMPASEDTALPDRVVKVESNGGPIAAGTCDEMP